MGSSSTQLLVVIATGMIWVGSVRSLNAQPTAFAPELVLSENTAFDQQDVRIRKAPDGAFLVRWFRYPSMPIRRFDASGVPIDTETLLGSPALDPNSPAAFEINAAGVMLVAFSALNSPFGAADSLVYFQKFTVDGTPTGARELVNSSIGRFAGRSVAALHDDGSFMLAWQDVGQPQQAPYHDAVFARAYDATGTPTATEFEVGSYTTGHQDGAVIVPTPGGAYLLTWTDHERNLVVAQAFDSAGAPAASEVAVATNQILSDVVASPAGHFLVLSYEPGSLAHGLRVDATGTPLAPEFVLGSSATGEHELPTASFRDDGSYVVAWAHTGDDADEATDVFVRSFTQNDTPQSNEVRLNTYRSGRQTRPAIAVLPGGAYFAAWDSLGTNQDGDGDGVFWTRPCFDDGPDTDDDGVADGCDACVGGAPIEIEPRIGLKSIDPTPPGNERVQARGEFTLPGGGGFASIDPLTTAVRVRLENADGYALADRTLPTTPFGGTGTAGWSRNGMGTKWRFGDRTETPEFGITSLLLEDRSSQGLGRARFKLKGKDSIYYLVPGDEPVRLTLTFGDPVAGICVQTDFVAAECSFTALNTRMSCSR